MIVDFHAHILPGMDDGCPTRIIAIRQMLMAQRAGVDVIVAAASFDPEQTMMEAFLEKRAVCARRLEAILQPGMPQVVLGAEVRWCPGLERLESLEALCIGNSGWLLLRLPDGDWDDTLTSSVLELNKRLQGNVILSCVETYALAQTEALFERGVHGQLSFEALEHHKRRERYLPWITAGYITALGSNLHGDAHVYHKLHKIQHKLDGSFEQIMDAAALRLRVAEQPLNV